MERDVSKDVRFTAWKILAAYSGESGGAWVVRTAPLKDLFRHLVDASGASAIAGRAILETWLDGRQQGPQAEVLGNLDPALLDDESLLCCAVGRRASGPCRSGR